MTAKKMIKALLAKGYTTYKIGEGSGIGQSNVSRIERGETESPRQSTFAKIEAYYKKEMGE